MELLIYDYLIAKCIGYENRVKAKTIMSKFDIKDHKTFRSYIQKIRDDNYFPRLIGSEAGSNGGYWIINSKEEFDETVHHLYARAYEMKKTGDTMTEKFKKLERGF